MGHRGLGDYNEEKNMLDNKLIESLEAIRTQYALSEPTAEKMAYAELLETHQLTKEWETKKTKLIEASISKILTLQEVLFLEKVIDTQERALLFIEHYAAAFFEQYKVGSITLKDSVLFEKIKPAKDSEVFMPLVENYPNQLRWLLEYVTSINNRAIANAPQRFFEEKLLALLGHYQIDEVAVERIWSSTYNEWSEPDYASHSDGAWNTYPRDHSQILLLKRSEFETLSKFDTTKNYRLITQK